MLRVAATEDARNEIRAHGDEAAAWIWNKIRHLREVGWNGGLTIGLVKDLGRIQKGIFEIIVKGKGESYRVFCFHAGGPGGQLVVLTSCILKSDLLGRRLGAHVKRAASRRDEWLENHREERQ